RRYSGIKLKKSIVIERPAHELYRFWHRFENLPALAENLESVETMVGGHSRWTVTTPGGIHLRWDAEITTDRENEMIGWRSVEGSVVETAGYVRFEPVGNGQSTRVRVALEYYPPAGSVGAGLLSLLGDNPAN